MPPVKEEPEEELHMKEEASDPEEDAEGEGEEQASNKGSSHDSSSVTSRSTSSSFISEGSDDTAIDDETSSSASDSLHSSDGFDSSDSSLSDASDDVDSQLSDRSDEEVSDGKEDGPPSPSERRVKGRGRRSRLIDERMVGEAEAAEGVESVAQSSVWVLYHDSIPDKNLNRKAYAASIDLIGTIETEEDLETFSDWIELDFVKDDFKYKRNLRLFRRGITPMWEDEQNSRGGRLIFWYGPDCKKGIAVPVWQNFLHHLLLQSCDLRPISGAVLHISTPRGICIDVWTNTIKLRKSWVQELRSTVLPTAISVTFKPHKPLAPPSTTGGSRAIRKGMRSDKGSGLNDRKRPREMIDLVGGGAAPQTTPSGRQVVRPELGRPRMNGERRRPLQVAPPQSSVSTGRRPTWNDPPVLEDPPMQRRRLLSEDPGRSPISNGHPRDSAVETGRAWALSRGGQYNNGGSIPRHPPAPHAVSRGVPQPPGRPSAGFRVIKRWE